MKKKLLALLIIGSAVVGTSCKKLEKATDQDVKITPTSIEFTIPVINSTAAGQTFGSFNADIDLNALVKQYASSFGVNNIKSIKITSFKVDLTNSDATNNFANMESVSGQISASGQTEATLVNVTSNPDTQAASLTFPVTGGNIELKNFVTGTQVKYTLKGKLRRVTTKALNAKVTMQYNFTFGL